MPIDMKQLTALRNIFVLLTQADFVIRGGVKALTDILGKDLTPEEQEAIEADIAIVAEIRRKENLLMAGTLEGDNDVA